MISNLLRLGRSLQRAEELDVPYGWRATVVSPKLTEFSSVVDDAMSNTACFVRTSHQSHS